MRRGRERKKYQWIDSTTCLTHIQAQNKHIQSCKSSCAEIWEWEKRRQRKTLQKAQLNNKSHQRSKYRHTEWENETKLSIRCLCFHVFTHCFFLSIFIFFSVSESIMRPIDDGREKPFLHTSDTYYINMNERIHVCVCVKETSNPMITTDACVCEIHLATRFTLSVCIYENVIKWDLIC